MPTIWQKDTLSGICRFFWRRRCLFVVHVFDLLPIAMGLSHCLSDAKHDRALLKAIGNLELTVPNAEALSKLGHKLEDVACRTRRLMKIFCIKEPLICLNVPLFPSSSERKAVDDATMMREAI
ncbi:hypothetical protein K1719_041828 [Acacia pycnantha]|nr:hypothetical protein K1719_041828 [Acacia pycnantha]